MRRSDSIPRRLLALALTLALAGCSPAATPTQAPTVTPTTSAFAAETEAWLHADLGPGETVVWYLGNCGYAIRSQNHFLIFDYQETYDAQARKRNPSAGEAQLPSLALLHCKDRGLRLR